MGCHHLTCPGTSNVGRRQKDVCETSATAQAVAAVDRGADRGDVVRTDGPINTGKLASLPEVPRRKDSVVYLLMALGVWRYCLALLLVTAAAAFDQQANSSSSGVSIVQPGAPGQNSRTLAAATVVVTPQAPLEADISFMQGMIHHHAQAVEMVDLLRTRSRNRKLQALGNRISISQTDEMKYMKQWLEDRGQPTVMAHAQMDHSAMGHDMKAMGSMPLMPGMLTPPQMQALAKASGPAFDHLFLTGMIQHHTGALIMVEDLFDTAGAGQDNVLYDFATDVDNTQRAEIEIMKSMLKEKK